MREGSSGGVTKSKARPVKVRNKAATVWRRYLFSQRHCSELRGNQR